MRKAGLVRGWSAVSVLTLACGMCSAQSNAPNEAANPSLSETAMTLAGEWEGQIQVRAADGSLSTSVASMTARVRDSGHAADLYYEGFAFGKPVDGAMILSLDADRSAISIADQAVRLRARCTPDPSSASNPDDAPGSLVASGSSPGRHGEVRAVFSPDGDDAWTIEYQSKDKDGSWSSMLTMHLSRMDQGETSAAANGFEASPLLRALRSESASASADPER